MKYKKIITLFILLIVPFFIKAASYPIGDVDGDKSVKVSDYVLIRKHLLSINKLTGDKLSRADVNSDGKVNVNDYVMIRKIILGQPVKSTPTYELKYSKQTITKVVGVRPFINKLTNTGSNKNIKYSSSNKKVAVVESDGTVKLLGVGKTTITAEVNDDTYKVKKATYEVNAEFNNIAYSLINDSGKTINSKEHVDNVVKYKSYNSIKVDLQPTKDGGLILCHDAGFTLTKCDASYVKKHDDLTGCEVGRYNDDDKDKTVKISDLTTKQATSLIYSGTNNHVATFEYYAKVMKNNPSKMPFVTVRWNITNAYPNSKGKTYVDRVLEILKSYGLEERTIINGLRNASNALDEFHTKAPNIMLSYVVSENDDKNISASYAKMTNKYDYYILSLYTFRKDQSETKKEIINGTFGNLNEVIKTARDNKVVVFTGTIAEPKNIVPNNYLVNHGISGSQINALLD